MLYPIIIVILAAYLLGNLNGSVCISTLFAKEDVRTHGSGNAGLTNFVRNYGIKGGLLVIVIDLGKTICACLLGELVLRPYGYGPEGMMLGAVAVSIGHDFPALLGFRGGKGILCGLGVAFAADWRIAIIVLSTFILVYVLTKYVSLGSIVSAAVYGVAFAVLHHDHPYVMLGGIVIGLLAIFMHRANIMRLIKGQERKTNLFSKGNHS